MKSQTRTSRGHGRRGRLKSPLGLLGTLTALFSVLALLGSSAAMADEDDNGCKDAAGLPTSNLVGASFTVSGNDTTYEFESVDTGSTEGVPGLIKYCVFPSPNGANTLPNSVVVDTTPGTGAQGWDGSFFSDPAALNAFSFDRNTGNESNIPLDGTTRTMGTATWSGGAPTEQAIVLHINDQAECNSLGENSETCWVLPGTTEIPPADALTATKDATPSFERTFEWDIEKEVDKTTVNIAEGGTATFNYTVKVTHDDGTDSGWVVTGTITVNNPNSGAVTGVEIEDSINDGNATCTVEGEATKEATIPAESSEEFEYECTYSAGPESLSETNTVTVSWGEQIVGGELLAEGTAEGEAVVDWENTVPDIIDGSIEVEDTLGGPLGPASWEEENPIEFTYPYEFEGVAGTCTDYNNKATFTTSDSEEQESAEQEVEVCVGADLTVSKTATPSSKRTFPWSITKEVDKTSVTQIGGNATFKYTITVTKGTGVDSDWAVSGTITVSNPNDWEAITADVTDAINDANATCTVTGGDDAIIPAGESEEFAYECTYSEAPASSSQTNTATATWDKEAASTPSESAEGTAPVDWSNPTLVDDCVETTDTVDGVPTTLDDPLCESKTYTPELTFPVPASGCVTHNNLAAFKTKDLGTTGEASQSVQVCGSTKTGALTIGFWQNKNGQKIITDGASTGGVCNSATWLRQYAPFQDLSATAKCKDVAAYVTKIIKAASASGAAMNAMLKAQMLATALNVYFSDPALGGNQIKAPAPIGDQKIDLTKVCKNIPTCSVFENTSSAFGGATSLTVSGILSYAASQSNSGGSVWYGQVKATQELAKDTFDAINNEVAFGA